MSLTLPHAAERARLRLVETAVEKLLVAAEGPLEAIVRSYGIDDHVDINDLMTQLDAETLVRNLSEQIIAAVTTAGRKTGVGHRFY
jgi:hypothetical protein